MRKRMRRSPAQLQRTPGRIKTNMGNSQMRVRKNFELLVNYLLITDTNN